MQKELTILSIFEKKTCWRNKLQNYSHWMQYGS